jgi:hypothetical protein
MEIREYHFLLSKRAKNASFDNRAFMRVGATATEKHSGVQFPACFG